MDLPQCLCELKNSDLEVAAEAALAAGRIVFERFGGQLMAIRTKSFGDFATEVDQEADAAISSRLRLSGACEEEIISEESYSGSFYPGSADSFESKQGTSGNLARLPKPAQLWIVDPLDATSSYIFRCGPQFPSVMIARVYNGVTTSAVIYFPLVGELFFAAEGAGCWLARRFEGKWGSQARIQLWTPCEELGESWVVLNRHSLHLEETKELRALDIALRAPGGAGLVTCEVPHAGAACRVAQGKFGAVLHDNSPSSQKQHVWDIAAPRLILEEAGGVFRNLRGQPVDMWGFEPMILAQSETLMQQILGKLL